MILCFLCLAFLCISLTCHLFLLFKLLTDTSKNDGINFEILGKHREHDIKIVLWHLIIKYFSNLQITNFSASFLWMASFIVPFLYVTTICHQTVTEAAQIIPIIHESIYEQSPDATVQIDVS